MLMDHCFKIQTGPASLISQSNRWLTEQISRLFKIVHVIMCSQTQMTNKLTGCSFRNPSEFKKSNRKCFKNSFKYSIGTWLVCVFLTLYLFNIQTLFCLSTGWVTLFWEGKSCIQNWGMLSTEPTTLILEIVIYLIFNFHNQLGRLSQGCWMRTCQHQVQQTWILPLHQVT